MKRSTRAESFSVIINVAIISNDNHLKNRENIAVEENDHQVDPIGEKKIEFYRIH